VRVFGQLQPAQGRNLGILFVAGLLFWASLSSLLPTLPLYVRRCRWHQPASGLGNGGLFDWVAGLSPCVGSPGGWPQPADRAAYRHGGGGDGPHRILALSDWIPWVALVRAFHGVSIAAFATAYVTLVVDFAPEEKRGEILGYMSLVNPIGAAIGPALGGFFAGVCRLWPFVFLLRSAGVGGLSLHPIGSRTTTWALGIPADGWGLLELSGQPEGALPRLGDVFGGVGLRHPDHLCGLVNPRSRSSLNPGLFYTAVAFASFGVRLLTGRASDRYGRGPFISLSLAT
jgi:MFS family permease